MAAKTEQAVTTAADRYQILSRARVNVLDQAREASRVTIPGLIPEEGQTDPHSITEQPYSSLGARGVNTLSAKFLLTFFPPEQPFFRQDVDPQTAEQLGAGIGKVQGALANISQRAMLLAESSGSRPMWMEVFRHLIVAGNFLVYHPLDGSKMRGWRLDQFVVRRDAQGQMVETITRERIYKSELDEAVRAAVGLDEDRKPKKDDPNSDDERGEEDKIDLYTWVRRDGDKIVHHEEINGVIVPGSEGQAPADKAGWQALRWQEVPGSDYGRSYVSEYAGDFLTLEDGTHAILDFAAEASRIIRIVDPNSGIDVDELARADTGEFLTGYIDKISTLQLEKAADFQVLWETMQMIERRLSQAFLLTSNTIRNAERVTAEEIRAIAQELEDAFGGTYAVLSTEVQKPYAKRLLYVLARKGEVPEVPKTVNVVIVTGYAALGRNHEVAALRDWLTDLRDNFGESFVQSRLNSEEIARRLGVGRGVVDVGKLIRGEEEVLADQQNATMTEAAVRAAPQLAKATADAYNAPEQEEAIG